MNENVWRKLFESCEGNIFIYLVRLSLDQLQLLCPVHVQTKENHVIDLPKRQPPVKVASRSISSRSMWVKNTFKCLKRPEGNFLKVVKETFSFMIYFSMRHAWTFESCEGNIFIYLVRFLLPNDDIEINPFLLMNANVWRKLFRLWYILKT